MELLRYLQPVENFSDTTQDIVGVSGYESSILSVASINVSWEAS